MINKMLTDKPIKVLIYFSLPLLIAYWSQQLYYILDWMIVGQFLGENALAAIGAPGSIFFLLNGIIQGMAAGFSLVFAHRIGRGNIDSMRKSYAYSILLSLLISVPLMIVLPLLLDSMLLAQNVDSTIFESTKYYVLIYFIGLPISLLTWLLTGNLRAVGNIKAPFIANILGSAINVLLDLILVGVFHLDIWVTALTNVISLGLIGLICFIYTMNQYVDLRPQLKDFKLSIPETLEHLKMGIPTALQFVITSVGIIFIQSALNSGGSAMIAGWTNGSKIDVIASQPLQALAVGVSVFFAQNHAVKNNKRLKEGLNASLIIGAICVVFAMSFAFFLGTPLTYLFVKNPSEELLKYSREYLIMFTLFSPFTLFLLVARNAFQAMQYHFFPLLGGFLESVARITCYFLVPTLGYLALLSAVASAWFTSALVLTIALLIHLYRKKSSDIESKDQVFKYSH